MRFASRVEAGKLLGQYLAERKVKADLVLGLPRGGVVVAAEVARILKLPLDILVVRKIGHPRYREFAVGALAEGEVIILDKTTFGNDPLTRAEVDEVIAEETERLRDYQAQFRGDGKCELADRSVVIVDDGLATGATAEVAVKSAKQQKAKCTIVAAPVASTGAVERLARVADDVIVLEVDPNFAAVGAYYSESSATTDEEVLALMRHHPIN